MLFRLRERVVMQNGIAILILVQPENITGFTGLQEMLCQI